MEFKGKVAIITGGNRGIGQAIARKFAEKGASAFIIDLGTDEDSKETVEAVEALGGRIKVFHGDISKPETNKEAFACCIETFGTPDFFIANAASSKIVSIAELSEEDYRSTFDTNVMGTLWGIHEAGRTMKPGGRIIVISSSTVDYPVPGMALYTGSKAALQSIVKVAAMELGSAGITVNAVLPGVTATAHALDGLDKDFVENVKASTPLGRIGEPEDIAKAISALCSEDAGWINGQFIIANGGGSY